MDDARVRRLTLVACILGSAIVFDDQTVVNLALPSLREDVGGVGNLVTLVVYAGLGAATFFVALFLQQVAGYSALESGFALLPITLMLIALSRRFGGLSARVGPRVLMSTGPLVGGIGLLAFARLDARADYLTGVLPAGLVFGLGLAMTVAPLMATGLEAADPRYAGIASGVNNAIARVAGLLAIAAVGAVVAAQLHAGFQSRAAAAAARDPAARAYLRDARERPLTLPRGDAPAPARAAVRDANVEAFRAGMIVSGLLMIAGGLIAAVGPGGVVSTFRSVWMTRRHVGRPSGAIGVFCASAVRNSPIAAGALVDGTAPPGARGQPDPRGGGQRARTS